MSQDLQELDDLFRSGLDGKSEAPPHAVWDAIEKRLDAANSAPEGPYPTAPPKTGLGWIKVLGGIALVGIIAATLMVTRKDAPIGGAGDNAVMKNEGRGTSPAVPTIGVETEQPPSNANREAARQIAESVHNEEPGINEVKITETRRQPPQSQSVADHATAVNADVKETGSVKSVIPVESTPTPATEKVEEANKSNLTEEKKRSSRNISDPSSTKASPEKTAPTQKPPTGAETQSKNARSPRAEEEKGFENRMMGNVMAELQSAPASDAKTSDDKGKTKDTKTGGRREALVLDVQKKDSNKSSAPADVNGKNSLDASGPTSPESLKPSRILSRFSVTPVMAYNHTSIEVRENRFHMGRPGDDRRSFRETEQSAATFSPGILAEFRISPALSIQSGVLGLTNRLRIDEKDIKAVRDRDGAVRYRLDCSAGSYFIDPKTGTAPNAGDSIRIGSSEVRSNYIGIPVTLQLRGGKGRVSYFASAGVNVNLLTGKQASAIIKGTSSQPVAPVRSEGLKTAFVSGVVGGGVDIRMNKWMSVTVQPQYRFSLGRVNEGFRENAFPKTFSVMSGFKFDF